MAVKDRAAYNAYMAEYIKKRYHQRRQETLQKLGGECVLCGSTEELEIDHIDPATKELEISKLWSVSKQRYDAEVAKCQLLCKPHHIEKTLREQSRFRLGGKQCDCGKQFDTHLEYAGHKTWCGKTIEVDPEIRQKIIEEYVPFKVGQEFLAKKYGLTRSLVRKILRP